MRKMRPRIKTFRTFESVTGGLTPEQESWLDKCIKGTWALNAEGLVDVEGDFNYIQPSTNLSDFHGIIFGNVSGNFNCNQAYLKSLFGAPQKVGGSFVCSNNGNLKSLVGAPREVVGDFDCHWCPLTSLQGAPSEVGGSFDCSQRIDEKFLTSLKGAPLKVGGNFKCHDNSITSLEGSPQKVGKSFGCSRNLLTSLKGAPSEVGEHFICSENKLTTLDGAPQKVGKNFICSDNFLTSLEGSPLEVGDKFYCNDNNLVSLEGAPRKIGGVFKFFGGPLDTKFDIPAGQWGPEGLLKAWKKNIEDNKDPKAESIIMTLLNPDFLNKLFREKPEQTMIDLQGVWNLPEFAHIRKQLKVPERYRDDMDLLGDMKELGF